MDLALQRCKLVVKLSPLSLQKETLILFGNL